MPKFTEGDYIDQNGAVQLLAYLLGKIKDNQRPRLMSTMSPAQCTECLLQSATENDWTAVGTLIQIQELTALTPYMKFKSIITQSNMLGDYDLKIIPAIYRYIPSNTPHCEIVAAGNVQTVSQTGWFESDALEYFEDILDPNETYYLVYFHNIANARMLGNQSVHIDSLPYVSWATQNLGDITELPESLDMESSIPVRLFGSFIVNADTE